MAEYIDLARDDPRMKCIRPTTYVWYDNNDDFCGWIVHEQALYILDEPKKV